MKAWHGVIIFAIAYLIGSYYGFAKLKSAVSGAVSGS